MAKTIKEKNITIAVLTVPQEAAQETALKLEASRIRAILNFTPVKLSLSKTVKVSNVDLAQALKTLSFFAP
jgi:redox-sensing transcriptional repressor